MGPYNCGNAALPIMPVPNDYKSALRLMDQKAAAELFVAQWHPDFSPSTVRRVGDTVAAELDASRCSRSVAQPAALPVRLTDGGSLASGAKDQESNQSITEEPINTPSLQYQAWWGVRDKPANKNTMVKPIPEKGDSSTRPAHTTWQLTNAQLHRQGMWLRTHQSVCQRTDRWKHPSATGPNNMDGSIPSSRTPALAKAKTGMMKKVTHGWSMCSKRVSGVYIFTPDSAACTACWRSLLVGASLSCLPTSENRSNADLLPLNLLASPAWRQAP